MRFPLVFWCHLIIIAYPAARPLSFVVAILSFISASCLLLLLLQCQKSLMVLSLSEKLPGPFMSARARRSISMTTTMMSPHHNPVMRIINIRRNAGSFPFSQDMFLSGGVSCLLQLWRQSSVLVGLYTYSYTGGASLGNLRTSNQGGMIPVCTASNPQRRFSAKLSRLAFPTKHS